MLCETIIIFGRFHLQPIVGKIFFFGKQNKLKWTKVAIFDYEWIPYHRTISNSTNLTEHGLFRLRLNTYIEKVEQTREFVWFLFNHHWYSILYFYTAYDFVCVCVCLSLFHTSIRFFFAQKHTYIHSDFVRACVICFSEREREREVFCVHSSTFHFLNWKLFTEHN